LALLEKVCHLTGAELPSYPPSAQRPAACSKEREGQRGLTEAVPRRSSLDQSMEPLTQGPPPWKIPRHLTAHPSKLRARIAGVWNLAAERAKQTTRLVALDWLRRRKSQTGISSFLAPVSPGRQTSKPAPVESCKLHTKTNNRQITAKTTAAIDNDQVSTPRYYYKVKICQPETPVYSPANSSGSAADSIADQPNSYASGQRDQTLQPLIQPAPAAKTSSLGSTHGSAQVEVKSVYVHQKEAGRDVTCPTLSSKAKEKTKSSAHGVKQRLRFLRLRDSQKLSKNAAAEDLAIKKAPVSVLKDKISSPRQEKKSDPPAVKESIHPAIKARKSSAKAHVASAHKALAIGAPRDRASGAQSVTGRSSSTANVVPSSEAISAVPEGGRDIKAGARGRFLLPTQTSTRKTQPASEEKRRPVRRWQVVDGVWRQFRSRTTKPDRGPNVDQIKWTRCAGNKPAVATSVAAAGGKDELPSSTRLLRNHIQTVRSALSSSPSPLGKETGNRLFSNGIEVYFRPRPPPKMSTHNNAGNKPILDDVTLRAPFLSSAVDASHNAALLSPLEMEASSISLPVKRVLRKRTVSSHSAVAASSRQLALVAALSAATAFGIAAAAGRSATDRSVGDVQSYPDRL